MPDLSKIDFKDIYVSEEAASRQPARYEAAVKRFYEVFPEHSDESDISIYSAPGRTEIGGNHTDHRRGRVVAGSVNLDIIGVVRKTDNGTVRILSEGLDMITVEPKDLSPRKKTGSGSVSLVRGVLYYIREAGYEIGGFDAYMTSDVLSGSGLSSSAAFETLIGTILSGEYNGMSIPPVDIAKAGQNAENKFFGKPCGLMDQCACSVGGLVGIDFKEPESPSITTITPRFEEDGYALCITDTQGSHAGLTGEYASVSSEMKRVASFLKSSDLCDVTLEDITRNMSKLRQKAGDRAVLRAIHFVTETNRADQEADALKNNNIPAFLKLVRASGDSSYKYLQNVYVSFAPHAQPVSLALAISDTILGKDEACRVHGGGFAGTIQAFVKKDHTATYKAAMDNLFGEGSCHILSIRKYGGIKVI